MGSPRVRPSDQGLIFTPTVAVREACEKCRSIRTEIHFLLHLGCLRAQPGDFHFELPVVREHVEDLRRCYFANKAVADLKVSDYIRKRGVEPLLGLVCCRRGTFERLPLEGTAVSGLHDFTYAARTDDKPPLLVYQPLGPVGQTGSRLTRGPHAIPEQRWSFVP